MHLFSICAVFLIMCQIMSSNAFDSRSVKRKSKPTPIVLWHGVISSVKDTKKLSEFLRMHIPGLYVRSIMIGKNANEDFLHSVIMDANRQIKIACEIIALDKRLRKGYNAIGLSQGGLFLRAVAERCPKPPMKTLITLGSPHQGVYGIPECSSHVLLFVCKHFAKMLSDAAYDMGLLRDHQTQAQFWHDPVHNEVYAKKSTFLADINNERPVKNYHYKENLLKLRNFVLVKFAEELIVSPAISTWFGFYAPGQEYKLVELRNMTLYKEDWLGLRELDETGRLHFLESPGPHMHYDWGWIEKNIVYRFLIKDSVPV